MGIGLIASKADLPTWQLINIRSVLYLKTPFVLQYCREVSPAIVIRYHSGANDCRGLRGCSASLAGPGHRRVHNAGIRFLASLEAPSAEPRSNSATRENAANHTKPNLESLDDKSLFSPRPHQVLTAKMPFVSKTRPMAILESLQDASVAAEAQIADSPG